MTKSYEEVLEDGDHMVKKIHLAGGAELRVVLLDTSVELHHKASQTSIAPGQQSQSVTNGASRGMLPLSLREVEAFVPAFPATRIKTDRSLKAFKCQTSLTKSELSAFFTSSYSKEFFYLFSLYF